MKARRTAVPGFPLTLFTVFFAMALIAYMPAAACAQPDRTGGSIYPVNYEIDPGPAP